MKYHSLPYHHVQYSCQQTVRLHNMPLPAMFPHQWKSSVLTTRMLPSQLLTEHDRLWIATNQRQTWIPSQLNGFDIYPWQKLEDHHPHLSTSCRQRWTCICSEPQTTRILPVNLCSHLHSHVKVLGRCALRCVERVFKQGLWGSPPYRALFF